MSWKILAKIESLPLNVRIWNLNIFVEFQTILFIDLPDYKIFGGEGEGDVDREYLFN